MKKASILMTVLFLTISMLAACGCRNSKPAPTTVPTTLPTTATQPTTEATTMPTTTATEPSNVTIPDGNGPISTDATTETDSTNARMIPGGTGNGTGTGNGNGITGSITG